jgi:signal transduction histidine kinase
MNITGEILIVDDTPENLGVLGNLLREQGHTVRIAINGPLALRSAQARQPDLILLDIRMPEMDGFEVCRRLRAIKAMAAIPIVFLSASDAAEDRVAAFDNGGQDFIAKPFHAAEVIARVQTHLSLSRTRRDLETANSGLERMLAVVAHDMRAPLHGIRTCVRQMVDRQEITAAGTGIAEAIQAEAGHLADLATDLIDISRISRGQMPWHWDGIDAGEVLSGVVAAMQCIAAESHVRLVLGDHACPPMAGDGSACRRLLINLVSNALKHAMAKTITLSAEPHGNGIRFLVVDDGRGIEPSAAARLGRPFAIPGDAASPLGGVGLGLAICVGIVAAHDGHLTIHSERRQGSRISADLRGDLAQPFEATDPDQRLRLDLR